MAACSDFSTPRQSDPANFCDPCSSTCYTCSGTPENCTSCYFNKITNEDLFYLTNHQCLSKCPVGYEANYSDHTCDKSTYKFISLPALFLLCSIVVVAVTLVLDKIIAGSRGDGTSDVALVALTIVEFLNRVLLLANLWVSTKSFSFCVTGVDILANSLLAIYFVTLVIEPIAKQI